MIGGISGSVTVLGQAIFLAALLFIGLMTLKPTPELTGLAARTPVWCLVCGDLGAIDVLMNILLFIPVGVGLRLMGWPLPRAAATALALSLVIEVLQMTAIPGRDASLSDLLTNTSGAVLGHWLAHHHRIWLLPAPIAGKRLFLASMSGWLAVTLLTAYGLAPVASDRPLYGQIAAQLDHLKYFSGEVLVAEAASRPMPNGRYPSSDLIRAALDRAEADLHAVVITGDRSDGLAPILSLADDRSNIILLLGQDKDALVYTAQIRASHARFRSPAIKLPHVFPSRGRNELNLGGIMNRRSLSVWAMGDGNHHRRVLSLSPNWSWALIFPFDFSLGSTAPVFTGLWLMVMLLPVTYWAGRATPQTSNRGVLAPVMTVMVAFLVIPATMGLNPVAWEEWVGAYSGIALGAAIARLSLTRQSGCAETGCPRQ